MLAGDTAAILDVPSGGTSISSILTKLLWRKQTSVKGGADYLLSFWLFFCED